MVSCVVESLKSEAKCPENLRRDLKWYLSEIGLGNNIFISLFTLLYRENVPSVFCFILDKGQNPT